MPRQQSNTWKKDFKLLQQQSAEELLSMKTQLEAARVQNKMLTGKFQIECEICMAPFKTQGKQQPKMLACGHTICLQCAQMIARGSKSIHCPFDRQPTAIPNGAHGLPKNFYLIPMCQPTTEKDPEYEQQEAQSNGHEQQRPESSGSGLTWKQYLFAFLVAGIVNILLIFVEKVVENCY